MGCVVSGTRCVRSLSDFRLTGRVSERTGGINGVRGILIRIGISKRRDGSNVSPGRTTFFYRDVDSFRGVEIGNVVAVTPGSTSRGRLETIFNKLGELSKRVGVPRARVGRLSVKVSKSCRVTVRRNTAVIHINANVFKDEWWLGFLSVFKNVVVDFMGGLLAVVKFGTRSSFSRRFFSRNTRSATGASTGFSTRDRFATSNGGGGIMGVRAATRLGLIIVRPRAFSSTHSVTGRLGDGGPIIVGLRFIRGSVTEEVISFLDNTICTLSKGVRGMSGNVFVVAPCGIKVVNSFGSRLHDGNVFP